MNSLFPNEINGGEGDSNVNNTNDLNQFFDGYDGVDVIPNVDHEEEIENGIEQIIEEDVQEVVQVVVQPRRRGRPAIKDPVLKKSIRNAREKMASKKYRLNKKLKANAFEKQLAKHINKNMDLLSVLSGLHIQYRLVWSLCQSFAHLMSTSNRKKFEKSRQRVDHLLNDPKDFGN